MRSSVFILVISFLFLTAANSSFAQVQPAAASKIVVVNTAAFFDEKVGITRIVAASKSLTADLAPKRNELQQMISRIEILKKEIDVLRADSAKGVPINQNAYQVKVDEFERLQREGKYKEDEYNALAQRRQNEIVGPAYSDALRALGEYVKSKAYGIVFDASKDQNGILIFATEQFDITKDFIAFYNSRPPTAITSVPK